MSYVVSLLVILFAAVLEAGGDRLMNLAMRGTGNAALVPRALIYVGSAAALTAYGYVVNTPDWDFGKLLGTYVMFFFFVAQILAWRRPTFSVIVGGALILTGGLVISLGK